MASLATTVAAVGALWFSGQSLRANENQYELSEQGLLTERFSRAVEQLGSSALDVRLGAVYSLERLSRDSVPDHPTIFEVLGAFVRTRSPVMPGCAESPDPLTEPRPSVDVQAALTAIGRRNADHDGPDAIDLSASCLAGASLTDADLYGADLAAGAVVFFFRLIGAAVGLPLLAATVPPHGGGTGRVFLLLSVLSVVGLVAVALLPNQRLRTSFATAEEPSR